MSGTVEQVLALANVDQCLKDTGATSTSGHCHNACTWLICRIKEALIPDYNIFLCKGTFWGKDHSWLLVQEEEQNIVVDMTVNQFASKRSVPYSGEMTDEYDIHESVVICMGEELIDLVERLG